ncbi:MAG: hypothetical protein IKY05_05345 [Bacteroidales bacterium]|nr:hypothetical protein [Bacteroidales bacterium]
MKKLFLIIVAALAFAGVRAQDVDVNFLPLSDEEKTTAVSVNFLENLYVGSISPIDSPKDMGLKAFKSWDLGFDIVNFTYKPVDEQELRFAVNFGTRFFKTRHRNVIWNEGGYYVPLSFTELSEDAMNHSKRKSRLDVYEFGLSAGYEFKVLDDFKIGVDVIGNYNFSAKSVTKYKVGSSKEKIKRKHWKTQKFTPEYRLTLGFPEIKLYLRVAPHRLFKKEYGPDITYFAFGIIL